MLFCKEENGKFIEYGLNGESFNKSVHIAARALGIKDGHIFYCKMRQGIPASPLTYWSK